MNEKRQNKVFTMTKQLKKREYRAHADFSLNCYALGIFISALPPSLMSCNLNVVDIFRDAVGAIVHLNFNYRRHDCCSERKCTYLLDQ